MGGFYLGCAMLLLGLALIGGLVVFALGLVHGLGAIVGAMAITGLLYGGAELTRI